MPAIFVKRHLIETQTLHSTPNGIQEKTCQGRKQICVNIVIKVSQLGDLNNTWEFIIGPEHLDVISAIILQQGNATLIYTWKFTKSLNSHKSWHMAYNLYFVQCSFVITIHYRFTFSEGKEESRIIFMEKP